MKEFIANNETTLIIGGIIFIFLLIVGYFLLKYLKGKLKINLTKTSFQNPEKIGGTLDLNAKQNISGNRLFVALVQYEKTRRRDNNGKISENKNEVCRFEVELEKTKKFPAGTKKSYNFEIAFPVTQNSNNADFADNKIANNIMKGVNLLASSGIIGGSSSKERYIESRLDAKGIDLTDSKRIYLN